MKAKKMVKKAIPAKMAAKALKMPAKATSPQKSMFPEPKVVKPKKGEPEDTGVGVGEAVRKFASAKNTASDLPDQNTQADKDRRMKDAKDKATKKLAELPMTPEHELVLKTTQLPKDARVMRYHDTSQWASCLMWVTYRVDEVKEKGKPTVTMRVPDVIHVIRTGSNGALDYEKMKPESAMYFAEIQGGYPLVPAIKHYRQHADTNGASAKVRELLGLSKEAPPQMVKVIERDEGGKVIGEKHVPKPPKGGNSNKATPNAELDELYTRSSRLLNILEKDLRQKYAHLNNGLQAMNLRNRLRNKGHNV